MNGKTVLIAICCVLWFGCKNTKEDVVVELITVQEMSDLLNIEKINLVDVRTPLEYEEGYISGAINIDIKNKDFENKIAKLDKSKPIAVYCRKGGRSRKSSVIMKKVGFTKIYDLDGGISQWKHEGKPIVK